MYAYMVNKFFDKKGIVSSINYAGKLEIYIQKNETVVLSHTIQQNQLQMD